MKNRIALLSIGIIGLIWISYISIELLKEENTSDYKSYFNNTDKQIIAINELNEIERNAKEIILPPTNEELLLSLKPKLNSSTFFISTSRPIIIIEQNSNWNKKSVQDLFKNGIYTFKNNGAKTYTFGKYKVKYSKKQLLLYACEISQGNSITFEVDKRSSYSKINFFHSGIEITDVYKKKNSTYFYKNRFIGKNNWRKHDDKKIFSSILPDKFTSYAFYDKNYLLNIDPEFKKSDFVDWVENGIVIIRNNGHSIAIFDFKGGQNPIQNLNDLYGKEELNEEFANFENVKFTSLIDKAESKKLFVAEFDGFCLASYDKGLIDEVLTEIKLGHSLSQNEIKLEEIYGKLPKKVSCRIYDSKTSKTISIFGNKSIEVECFVNKTNVETETKNDREYFAMNPGERVLDFASFNERGNIILLTENKKLIGYINGLRKWEKTLSGEVTIKPFHYNNKLVCVFNDRECQMIDMYGKIVFRYNAERNICPESFEYKSKMEYLIANTSNNFAILSDKGELLKQFSCTSSIKEFCVQKINNKNIALVLTNSMLYSVDLEKRKTIQKVSIDSTYHTAKDNNGLYAVSLKNGELNIIDYKANKKTSSVGNYSNICTIYQEKQDLCIVLQNQKSIGVFNIEGKRKWVKSFNINELSQLLTYKAKNGNIVLTIFDGIENQLYLYDSNGNTIDSKSKHAEQKIEISSFGLGGYSITTFLGSYLIQYNKL